MKKNPILGIDILPTEIGGIQISCIDWLVETEDILDMLNDDMSDDEVDDAIDKFIEENLPKEVFVPFRTNDIKKIDDKVRHLDDWLSDTYGFLLNGFNYDFVGVDGKPYEKWPRN